MSDGWHDDDNWVCYCIVERYEFRNVHWSGDRHCERVRKSNQQRRKATGLGAQFAGNFLGLNGERLCSMLEHHATVTQASW